MDEAPVILLACSGTDFPTYAELGNPRSITATLHASIYPAVQNTLLACRAYGIGATLTTLHYFFEDALKSAAWNSSRPRSGWPDPTRLPAGAFWANQPRRGGGRYALGALGWATGLMASMSAASWCTRRA